jgi:hypothetical protein
MLKEKLRATFQIIQKTDSGWLRTDTFVNFGPNLERQSYEDESQQAAGPVTALYYHANGRPSVIGRRTITK